MVNLYTLFKSQDPGKQPCSAAYTRIGQNNRIPPPPQGTAIDLLIQSLWSLYG